MDFSLNDEQKMLIDTVRRFIAEECQPLEDEVEEKGYLDEAKANESRKAAEEALKNAKSDVDLAKAQSELAVMAAQIAALRKYRQKR